MTASSSAIGDLVEVIAGADLDKLGASGAHALHRFCERMDGLGARRCADASVAIYETRLVELVSESVEARIAEALVALLRAIPAGRLVANESAGDFVPIPWAELSRHVVVFDSRPDARGSDLELAGEAPRDLVTAVNHRFPSMEEELIDADVVPPRVDELVSRLRQSLRAGGVDPSVTRAFDLVSRNLGWWGCVALVLVLSAACLASSADRDATPGASRYAWPLYVFVLTAAVGGWTLTMVESLILARTTHG